jgi:hypothetical protein
MVTLLHLSIHHCESQTLIGEIEPSKEMIQDLHTLYIFDEIPDSDVSTRQSFALFSRSSTNTSRLRCKDHYWHACQQQPRDRKLAANARQSTRRVTGRLNSFYFQKSCLQAWTCLILPNTHNAGDAGHHKFSYRHELLAYTQ